VREATGAEFSSQRAFLDDGRQRAELDTRNQPKAAERGVYGRFTFCQPRIPNDTDVFCLRTSKRHECRAPGAVCVQSRAATESNVVDSALTPRARTLALSRRDRNAAHLSPDQQLQQRAVRCQKLAEIEAQTWFAHAEFLFIETASPERERELFTPFCRETPELPPRYER